MPVLVLGKAGTAGTEKGVLPVLRDDVVVATLRASNWKEAATAVVENREWVLAKTGRELTGRQAPDPEGTARLRARQTSWWRSTWEADLEGTPVQAQPEKWWQPALRYSVGGRVVAEGGSKAITVADVPGVTLAGLLIDAGAAMSPVLVEVGPRGAARDHAADPTLLADLFFRVGGARVGNAETALEINSRHVLGDHLWIWRADHGDREGGRVHVGWSESVGNQGLVVNGDDVTLYGLFVEHFRRYQTYWAGERGRTFFYQNELPYDPPSQAAWRSGSPRGWAAYKVADDVTTHHATGLGIYANFTADPSIVLDSAVEVPDRPGVRIAGVTTISLGGGKGTIAHPVNRTGAAARPGAIRQTLVRYPVAGGDR